MEAYLAVYRNYCATLGGNGNRYFGLKILQAVYCVYESYF